MNDENLTPADFLDHHVSPNISCHKSPKPVDCNDFKTPLNSRCVQNISETPSLFSQDESVNHTPISSECPYFFFLQIKLQLNLC